MKRNIKTIFLTALLLLTFLTLISCEKAEKTESEVSKPQNKINYESIVTTFENPQTKQKFKIVHAYKLFQSYIDKVKSNPDNSYLAVYKEEVIEPIYSDCFQDGEYIYMADPIIHADPDQLDVTPTHLAEVQKLIENIDKQQTDKIIKEALIKSSDLLPAEKETTACVLPSANKNSNMITVGAGKILVLYNWYYTEEALRAGVAHEYHHSVWTEKYFSKDMQSSVLDNLIFEGKAVMFEKLVYPEIDYTHIDLTNNKNNWSKIAPDLEKKDFNRSTEILFGGKDLPWLYGYSEGYKMVKSYLELNPNETPVEWTGISVQDVFEKGKYLENYK